ncbi:helix-turn-helix transcriptional regulator [Amycolatopsis sp. K13G38]|uniref:Helix-turn-helix transcriptional regulator n=1 Tax=Amycolatopsis acididurans TaxID=2724524 RepID=A0ABX1JCJ6_9PSEU|nr:helix-turn-helix transcriptional regulator [Amycolatopsis acididurans]NKQ56146.1 helix-turn-helix transcriptional regulator [Amycolatopsis acididurans]
MVETTTRRLRRDRLSVGAYERVFGVLEQCDGAASVDDFKERLVEALPSAYRIRYASVFVGPTLHAALADRHAVISDRARADRMYELYLERWSWCDVYRTPAAVDRLVHKGMAVLSSMVHIPLESRRYVESFLVPAGLTGSAAIRLPLGPGAVAVVGLFGPDPRQFESEDACSLDLLARRLASVSRLLPSTAERDVLTGIRGRQRDVALLVGQGLTNADVAARLHLAEDTVKKYVSRVLAATGCRTRTELALSIRASTGSS